MLSDTGYHRIPTIHRLASYYNVHRVYAKKCTSALLKRFALGRTETILVGSIRRFGGGDARGESRFIDESGDAVTDGRGIATPPQHRKLLFKQTRFSNFRDGYPPVSLGLIKSLPRWKPSNAFPSREHDRRRRRVILCMRASSGRTGRPRENGRRRFSAKSVCVFTPGRVR